MNQQIQFSQHLATELGGVGLAILCQYFIDQIKTKISDGAIAEDGHVWHKVSKSQLVKLFPFWTEERIRRKLETLSKKKILKTKIEGGTFERSCSYAFCDEARFVREVDNV